MAQVWEVFWRFLSLGCVSFGGPAAHIGYFQKTFVQDLKWLDDKAYGQLVALGQFLPGPGSSLVGFAIGIRRAGLPGGIAAFLGFTLPSFLIMYLLGVTSIADSQQATLSGLIHGLKLLAVVVVADATFTMWRNFSTSAQTVLISILAAVVLLLFKGIVIQIVVLAVAGGYGFLKLSDVGGCSLNANGSLKINLKRPWALSIFAVLFLLVPFLTGFSGWLQLFNDFFQAGSLVFGGGHVVLPLLQQTVGDAVSQNQFLTGYAAAQAVPGPMFSLATFLGSSMSASPLLGALLATLGIFLPGFLLVLGFMSTWESLANHAKVAGAIKAINAAVVGLLLAALYDPVFVSSVKSNFDAACILIGFYLINRIKLPVLWLVLGFALAGIVRSIIY